MIRVSLRGMPPVYHIASDSSSVDEANNLYIRQGLNVIAIHAAGRWNYAELDQQMGSRKAWKKMKKSASKRKKTS